MESDAGTKISRIVIDNSGDDVTFYFDGTDIGWNVGEFVQGTDTRNLLEDIEGAIIEFNFGPPVKKDAV
jgi:hypothetical protein